MQAFLWRHLVPARDLKAVVYDPAYTPPPKRVPRTPATAPAQTASPASASAATKPTSASSATRPTTTSGPAKPTFTKQQVAGLLRQLKYLYGEGLLTDDFYDRKVAECTAAQ